MTSKLKFIRCKSVSKRLSGHVAIVGAGPAGLTAAGALVCDGLDVDVYDMLREPGGLLIFGIPEFRIPKDRVRSGIEELVKAGVSFTMSKKVGDDERSDILLDEILMRYDATLIATGAWEPRRMNIEGEDLDGVFHAAPYIVSYYSAKLGYIDTCPPLSRSAAVIGGGLTAVDSCLVALEQGVGDVYLVYRRTKKEAPAGEKEMLSLERRGVKVLELKAPIRLTGEKGKIKSMITLDMKLGPPDKSGRPAPEPIPNSEKELFVDSVIVAIGGLPTPPFRRGTCGIKLASDGRILVDDKKRTTRIGVFAAGDVETGPSLIGPAVKSGLEAALAIKEYIVNKQWT